MVRGTFTPTSTTTFTISGLGNVTNFCAFSSGTTTVTDGIPVSIVYIPGESISNVIAGYYSSPTYWHFIIAASARTISLSNGVFACTSSTYPFITTHLWYYIAW